MGRIQYRPEIDGLRALAVLAVVLFHFFSTAFPSGYLGVDVFFVISGYLITTHLLKLDSRMLGMSLLEFYRRRIARLFPALFVCLLFTYAAVRSLYLSVDLERFETSLLASYTFWANIYFWRDGGYFGGNDQLKPLLHIWSLSIEEQFYILFPFILVGLCRLTSRPRVLGASIGILTLLSFGLWLYLLKIGGSNPAFFLLPSRAWQFGVGALCAIALKDGWSLDSHTVSKVLLLVSIMSLVACLLLDVDGRVQTLIVTVSTAIFIATSNLDMGRTVWLFRSRIARWFGQVSYSLYLYHWPIAAGLSYYFVGKIPLLVSWGGVITSVLLGFLSFRFIETPFRRHLPLRYSFALLVGCVVASSVMWAAGTRQSNSPLAERFASALDTNYRCPLDDYRSYGASRACEVVTSVEPRETLVLLGNSHAQMYAPLVAASLPSNVNLLLVPLNGCLPTVTVNLSPRCLQMARDNLATVLEDESVSRVVVASTWYEADYITADNRRVSPASLIESMSDLVKKINDKGKRVILISPIAIPGKSLASILSRNLAFGHESPAQVMHQLKRPRGWYDAKFKSINDHFSQMLGASYIRSYEDLCDEGACFFGGADGMYFSDGNHLSADGIKRLTSTRRALGRLLKQ